MNRRHLILNLAGAAFSPDAFSHTQNKTALARKKTRQPNFVFILADDLGYADLSCYGRRDYQTPVLDRLALQGSRFVSAYSNSPVCSATRTALITGRYQYRFPIGLEEPLTTRDIGLSPDVDTLPSLLRDVGYDTALIGKWHLGELPNFSPLKSGYNQFWGFRGGGIDYFTHVGTRTGKRDLWDGDHPTEANGYLTTLLADRAIKLINNFSKRPAPFFLSLHFSAPHWPWEGPEDQAEASRLANSNQPNSLSHFDGGSLKTYARMVRSLDTEIGRVLAALERQNLTENTVVIFSSDNGGERFSDTWPFSGRKSELLEGGIRIPAIVRWPNRVKSEKVIDTPILSMDWMPTILRAANAPIPASLDGVDISPIFENRGLEERTLFWRYRNLGQEAARRGNFKYLKIAGNSFLFDLKTDPLERANLKLLFPETFRALVDQYETWNKTMLPEDSAATSMGFRSFQIADRPEP